MAQPSQEKNYELYLEADVSSYIGKWVALCEGKIIAFGVNARKVAEEAKGKSLGKRVLIARVPDKEAMIF